jgi:bifunctional DNase/RNase
MEKVELRFLRITYSHTHAGAYALILSEVQGDRRLPIIIGGVEAQAIAIQVENIKPARPLTHDLFKNVSDTLGINLKEVIINDLVEGIFHAKLVVEQKAAKWSSMPAAAMPSPWPCASTAPSSPTSSSSAPPA